MLARLQQCITFGLLTVAVVWLAAWWRYCPVVAVVGALATLFGYTVFLAVECMLMVGAHRGDPAPAPRPGQVLRAWLHECVTSPRVFYWRQPFRYRAVPDHLPADGSAEGRRGVVLVHGLFGNRGFWTPWMQRLRRSGHPFVAVSLEPVFCSIDDYAPTIDAAVARLQALTGRPPVLVCHSMGGLAARAWLRRARAQGDGNAAARVHRIVTIGTPHHGTVLAHCNRGVHALQMRPGSDWLAALARSEPVGQTALFDCWYSNCDHIVFPCSTAALPGADNRLVAGLPHVALAFHPPLVRAVLDEVGQGGRSGEAAHLWAIPL
ncbi:esterase/lipase family protein [Xylophilus ampelinus]|uniref:Alpha/beta hydrolase family protein n=1 Tax=Xylophilus ampelinus TaxID=54067 RepID=A0A318SWT9_9BURK|nr:alpha/beta fold hydrolase [Xylophilus ampelinus]MCS4510904.1 alpha/beta fold hydrolase [Xylophilus ampelinus]PYE76063.1 alpha/beta hydrolase family protein [Xylophilus ampelinus]